MSRERSPATGAPYGVTRVCAAFEHPRSSYYARRAAQTEVKKMSAKETLPSPALHKRGPKTPLDDDALLALIRADLAASPFVGEGHRKVWARLRFAQGVRVARKRVLRIMRKHNLLSPRRVSQGVENLHDGQITTDAPNVMWGIDGARILTADQGWCWAFLCVEHFNAECVGFHVSKRGTRIEALEPVRMAVKEHFGSVGRNAARGLALRMDHGCQFLADHFQNEIKFLGVTPSLAFLGEPQTNGVAERFIRTLREQAIHGRIFKTVEDVRQAVREFVTTYNREWRVEKRGFMTPNEARSKYLTRIAA